ncbi:DUF1552 domain-containing protein [Pseudenhygromyxa sp. WMMC2535]|uniref:DUF1552 domain-containing protein n=1 Tax=Pseudenhygromyxa sp. WMMC2535 TaxID=2712867 RepID=UPI001556C807|nr:DUF1552 domain-containing protein [Pseudenhygromyxa sp. WMMC2535]NVB41344.1 DUF1552 domain-containing protein [Pseudenhygromyxa sp. WMMC2535]
MINRRKFIASSGLLAGAALFSGALGRQESRGSRGGEGGPRRFVIFLEGNGTRPACMRDPLTLETLEGIAGGEIGSSRDYGHSDPVLIEGAPLSEARALGALAGSGDALSLVDRAALVLGLSGTHLGGGHSTDHGALCASKSTSGPSGPSIESVLAEIPGVRGSSPFDALRVGIGASSNPLNYASCAFAAGKPAPILLDPSAVFSTLFGSVALGDAGSDFQSRKDLLAYALEDVQLELAGGVASSRGREKLETYEASLLDMMARDAQIEGMQDALSAAKPAEPGTLDPDPYVSSDPLIRLGAQVDLVSAGLISGLTNVAVVSLGSGAYYWSQQYPSLVDFYPDGQLIGGHDLRHGDGGDYYEVLHELSSRYIGQMCRLARELAAVPEEGGSMLDNTLLLYMPDNGEKHHSNAEEFAMLMLGGNNMGFHTDGRSVSYPKSGHANNRQVSNMFNTLLYGAGQPTDDFGHANADSRVAEGPLAELWTQV